MKYVMFEKTSSGSMFPIVFPEHIDHSYIAGCVTDKYPHVKPVSAGFCSSAGIPHGQSISLKLIVGDMDKFYLQKMFKGE